MPRIITVLLTTALFAGCSTDGKFRSVSFDSPACGGTVSGYTVTFIAYGDSKLVVIPLSKIRPNTEWRFYLKPIKQSGDPHDYDTVNVMIEGKDPADPPPPTNRNNWIDPAPGSYDSTGPDHYLVDCVKPNSVPGENYQYEIIVDEVGTLDPRADVY